jgi:hypothetical protein
MDEDFAPRRRAPTIRRLLEPSRAPSRQSVAAAAKSVRDRFSTIHDGVWELVATG